MDELDLAARVAALEGQTDFIRDQRAALLSDAHSLRDAGDAILSEKIDGLAQRVDERIRGQQQAVEIAEREREKAARALQAERLHADATAEQERHKAAQALATALQQSIKDGDERLRDHIVNQIEQIRAALTAQESLSVARVGAVREAIAATTERFEQRFDSTQEAVAKADVATEKRFESVNEFRAQLGDQVREFLPREVADAQISEIRKSLADSTRRLDVLAGKSTGAANLYGYALGGVTLIISVIVLLANHAFGG